MPTKNPISMASEHLEDNMSDERKFEILKDILSIYKNHPGNLINALYAAQTLFGFLPDKVLIFISENLNEPISKITGVVTFYSYFKQNPTGKYSIKVCLGTACYVRGGKDILEKIKKKLGIGVGETTKNGLFSLEIVRCIGACALAPVVVINNDTHRRVKINKIDELLKNYKSEINN